MMASTSALRCSSSGWNDAVMEFGGSRVGDRRSASPFDPIRLLLQSVVFASVCSCALLATSSVAGAWVPTLRPAVLVATKQGGEQADRTICQPIV
jgi:hypothetical protein